VEEEASSMAYGIKARRPTKKKKAPVPKGMHRMPNGKLMKGTTHKGKKK
jgi:hypothetical protein